jgi:hypothetical protein
VEKVTLFASLERKLSEFICVRSYYAKCGKCSSKITQVVLWILITIIVYNGFDSQQKTFHDTVPLGPKNAVRNSAVIKGLCYEIDFQYSDMKTTSFGYK